MGAYDLDTLPRRPMGNERSTLTPAKLFFAGLGENVLDVTEFSVVEPMSSLFEVSVVGSSSDGKIALDSIVGRGAAFAFPHHSGPLIWAGICKEAGQLRNPDAAGI